MIAVDPYTTHPMKRVYGGIVEEYDIKVWSYMEVLEERGLLPVRKTYVTTVIHCPPYYTRYLDLVDEPRRLLMRGGVTMVEASRGKLFTSYCGGLIEFIAPRLAESVAKHRLEELRAIDGSIVTLCPICHLRPPTTGGKDIMVADFVDHLYAIYGD